MDGIIFTHEHGDHKDPDLLYYVAHNYSPVSVYSYETLVEKPELQQIEKGIYRLQFSEYEIYFIVTIYIIKNFIFLFCCNIRCRTIDI